MVMRYISVQMFAESDVSVLHNGRTMAHLELSEESHPTCSLSIV